MNNIQLMYTEDCSFTIKIIFMKPKSQTTEKLSFIAHYVLESWSCKTFWIIITVTDKHFIINLLRMFSYFKNLFESWEPPIDHGSLGGCSWKTWTRNNGRAHPVKIITISLAVPYTVCIYMYKCNKTFKINKYVMYNGLKK